MTKNIIVATSWSGWLKDAIMIFNNVYKYIRMTKEYIEDEGCGSSLYICGTALPIGKVTE